ncbi:hypothetical protein OROHE_023804 [Orobanche hederae]
MVPGRVRIMWCMRLRSALRMAFACTIVGCTTLYGPKFIVDEIKFAAFSYLTVVLIASDATLGETLRGCWHAFYATVQVIPLAMLVRRIVSPYGAVPVSAAAAAVAVASFVVALPECTHLTAKRIAFGQIVLVCSDAVVIGDGSGGVMRPVYVAASTGLGALASVLASMIPCPGLACYEVRKLCRVYAENASQRINLYLRAFGARDCHTKMELISQAKPLAETGDKLLQCIRILQIEKKYLSDPSQPTTHTRIGVCMAITPAYPPPQTQKRRATTPVNQAYLFSFPNYFKKESIMQEGMQWERPWIQYLIPNLAYPEDIFQRMELQMRGMEYSLTYSHALPSQGIDQEQLSNVLQCISTRLHKKIEQQLRSCYSPFDPTPEFTEMPSLLSLQTMFPTLDHDWLSFYFSCIEDMQLNNHVDDKREFQTHQANTLKTWFSKLTSKKRLEFAFKCSLSLSLAVLFGSVFDRENGCWAGLTIAVSSVTGRQAVFTIANSRAQGTAIGSVYGIICCFLFHYKELRLLALIPWIISTSFLMHSKMYGQTGGVSAAIGALLILGRKHYGPPNEFAIARLSEVFIGLSAFIVVEILLQPVRAATLAKNHLCRTLSSLHDCIKETKIYKVEKNQIVLKFIELRGRQRNFNSLVLELEKFVAEADLEPDFWYLPFRTSCYRKLVGSLTNISDLLYFITYNFGILLELCESSSNACEELFKESLTSWQVYLETANMTESRSDPQENMQEKFRDIEAGKLQYRDKLSNVSSKEHEEANRTTEEARMMQCLGATRFCIGSLMREIDNIKICLRDINQWENHSSK